MSRLNLSVNDKKSKKQTAIKLYKGLSIYKYESSKNWFVRIWDSKRKKYVVKSTGFDNVIDARAAAQELGLSLLRAQPQVETQYTFKHFALKFLNKISMEVNRGEKSNGYKHSLSFAIQNNDWGLLDYFGDEDVRNIKTVHYEQFLNFISEKRSDLSASTKNSLMSAFRNVLKVARDEGLIDYLPPTPRTKQRDNPRPFFRFHPLVNKNEDNYKRLLDGIKKLEGDLDVRGFKVDEELYDLALFITHSFVRPTTTELYAIKHRDVTIADNPRRLLLTIRDGKTGYRQANTMPAAVSVYERIIDRYPKQQDEEDYIFYPEYENRQTISAMVQRLFKAVLDNLDLRKDYYTGLNYTLYSLRHTAICMRIVNSKGDVNIYNLAKNAGTSVGQIERFYAKHLPLSAELAENLQSFGR